MNILYIHGLNGSLSNEKRAILETYGTVYSPSIDYETDEHSIAHLKEEYLDKDIHIVMGSSMGGFVGYHLSIAFQTPALLFNPALAARSVFQQTPEYLNPNYSFKYLVLGAKDEVVNPKGTLEFLAERLHDNVNYNLNVRQDLAHRISLEVFEEEVDCFFKRLI